MTLPQHKRDDVRRILDGAARRILAEQTKAQKQVDLGRQPEADGTRMAVRDVQKR